MSSPAFFMRIASLSDETQDEEEKQKLAALASNLVVALEVVVQVPSHVTNTVRARARTHTHAPLMLASRFAGRHSLTFGCTQASQGVREG